MSDIAVKAETKNRAYILPYTTLDNKFDLVVVNKSSTENEDDYNPIVITINESANSLFNIAKTQIPVMSDDKWQFLGKIRYNNESEDVVNLCYAVNITEIKNVLEEDENNVFVRPINILKGTDTVIPTLLMKYFLINYGE